MCHFRVFAPPAAKARVRVGLGGWGCENPKMTHRGFENYVFVASYTTATTTTTTTTTTTATNTTTATTTVGGNNSETPCNFGVILKLLGV